MAQRTAEMGPEGEATAKSCDPPTEVRMDRSRALVQAATNLSTRMRKHAPRRISCQWHGKSHEVCFGAYIRFWLPQ